MLIAGAWLGRKFGWYGSSLQPLHWGSVAAEGPVHDCVSSWGGTHGCTLVDDLGSSTTCTTDSCDCLPRARVTTRRVLAPAASGTSTQKLPSGRTRATGFAAVPVCTMTTEDPGPLPWRPSGEDETT